MVGVSPRACLAPRERKKRKKRAGSFAPQSVKNLRKWSPPVRVFNFFSPRGQIRRERENAIWDTIQGTQGFFQISFLSSSLLVLLHQAIRKLRHVRNFKNSLTSWSNSTTEPSCLLRYTPTVISLPNRTLTQNSLRIQKTSI